MPEIDHWEALFDKNYLRWFHLKGQDVTVEIEKVERNVELTMRGGKKSKKTLIHFKGKDKPLVLNATNGESIAELHGNKPTGWIGQKVVLFQSVTSMYDKEKKKMVEKECIRIKGVK